MNWRLIGAIGLGGAGGALSRFGVSAAVTGWPLAGTLFANVAGSFLVGLIAAWTMRRSTAPLIEALLVTGFCGGFTTFSMFSLEALMLVVGGDWAGAGTYVLVSVAAWLAAVWLGWRLGLALIASRAPSG